MINQSVINYLAVNSARNPRIALVLQTAQSECFLITMVTGRVIESLRKHILCDANRTVLSGGL